MRTVSILHDNIRIFNTLAIETSAVCNRSCVFCPVHGSDRPDEKMDWGMIEKIAEELEFLRWQGRISLYIYNEPMRDQRIYEIISYLRGVLPSVCLMISTNGDYLKSSSQIQDLRAAGVNQLLINVYSATDGNPDPKRVAHGVELAERRHKTFLDWFTDLGIDKSKGSVYTYLKPPGFVCKIEPKYGVRAEDKNLAGYELQNRSGNIDWFQAALKEPMERGCVRPFRLLNINWRGDGILCCNDYHGVTDFGNIREKSLVDIWNHPEFHRYRLFLQNKNRYIPLCDKCDYRGGIYPHMIEKVTFGDEKDALMLAGGL